MKEQNSSQPDVATSTDQAPPRRRRGRPPANANAEGDIRSEIIKATVDIYGQFGFNGSSVERIIEAANVSRPTFYRLFKDRYEVIDIVVENANNQLKTDIFAALENEEVLAGGVIETARVAVSTYFDWCQKLGPLVGSLYAEMHDSNSPASKHRERLIEEFVVLVHNVAKELGRPQLEPVFYDVLVCAVEHAASTAFSPDAKPQEVIDQHKAAATRVLLAGLAAPEDLDRVPALDSLKMR